MLVLLIGLYFRNLLGVLGSGAIAACVVFIAGLYAAGYLLGGSRVETRGVLGLGTAARNVGAALVPASQSFSDPKVMIMLVAFTIVMLVMLISASGWLRRKALRSHGRPIRMQQPGVAAFRLLIIGWLSAFPNREASSGEVFQVSCGEQDHGWCCSSSAMKCAGGRRSR